MISNSIDQIILLASKDKNYMYVFYKALLDTELYVLSFASVGSPGERSFTSNESTKIAIRQFDDGKVPIFTSMNKIFENGIIKGDVHYTAMNGRDMFEMLSNGFTVWLNPYSSPSKIFLPEEIKNMLSDKDLK